MYKDVSAGTFFSEENPAEYKAFNEEVKAGKARVEPMPGPSVAHQRKTDYVANGVSIEAMTVAMWEHFVEQKPGSKELLDELQSRRQAVKEKHPNG